MGWHSRGYLPHLDADRLMQHVTFRLADSLPAHVLVQMDRAVLSLPEEDQKAEKRRRTEAWLDAGHGSCILRDAEVAAMVEEALLHFDAERYRLLAWVVMPNHVHVLFQPINSWEMSAIVASWKKFTGTCIAQWMRNGQSIEGAVRVWHREYWDRYMRDEEQCRRVIDYIHHNPVKAGLVASAELWRWSSCWSGRRTVDGGGRGG